MDQLSVVVPPDQDLIDSIAPETLDNDLGHGDSPQTSESLNNDNVMSPMTAKPSEPHPTPSAAVMLKRPLKPSYLTPLTKTQVGLLRIL